MIREDFELFALTLLFGQGQGINHIVHSLSKVFWVQLQPLFNLHLDEKLSSQEIHIFQAFFDGDFCIGYNRDS